MGPLKEGVRELQGGWPIISFTTPELLRFFTEDIKRLIVGMMRVHGVAVMQLIKTKLMLTALKPLYQPLIFARMKSGIFGFCYDAIH